jgi:hypothetical protein
MSLTGLNWIDIDACDGCVVCDSIMDMKLTIIDTSKLCPVEDWVFQAGSRTLTFNLPSRQLLGQVC